MHEEEWSQHSLLRCEVWLLWEPGGVHSAFLREQLEGRNSQRKVWTTGRGPVCCEAKRPGDEKKNKKWHPDCGSINTLAIHPFKRIEEYKQCISRNGGVLKNSIQHSHVKDTFLQLKQN